MFPIWPLVVVLFAAALWVISSLRWTGWRRVAAVYGVATAFASGLALIGWLGDCAPHEIDGQCGMSALFLAIIGLLGAFIIIALGHLLPALQGPRASRGRSGDEQAEASANALAGQHRGVDDHTL
jgi:hypothetical protein